MKQLGILDSAFINLENPVTPQHVGGLSIYDPSTAPGGFVRFKEVLANFEQRLHRLPLFRTRLVAVPGDFDRPYWIEDKNFDVEFHIRHISLPNPGDWRQLWIQVARLHARSLDMSRPLWEAYIIEGLDNIEGLPKGAFAMYTKMHHSLVDGAGGASFMSALHDLQPVPEKDPNSEPNTIIVDRQPGEAELFLRGLLNRTTGSLEMMRGFSNAISELVGYGLDVARDKVPKPAVTAPKTRFNNRVGPHRVAEAAVFELQDFKDIKNAVGATVNDVALSIIGGAMRNYLRGKGELPEESLVAGVPLNMRERRESSSDNNQVASMFTRLHTEIADPVERVSAVRESAGKAKQEAEISPLIDSLKVAGFFSPLLSKTVAEFWARNHISRFIPLNISTVVTNVPGPNFPLYCAGAEMVRYHGLGLLTPGCALFQTVFSSNGMISITILADRNAMPDPETYKECLEQSFLETYQAALGRKPGKASAMAAAEQTAGQNKSARTGAQKSRQKKAAKRPGKVVTTKRAAKTAPEKPAPVKRALNGSKAKRSPRSIVIPKTAKRTTSSRVAVAPKRKRKAVAEA